MARTGESFKNVIMVSFGTLVSRVLGLVRDMLTMAYLGVGAVSSAFIFGFTIPNLFRRLMGEGALSSAFIPVFSNTLRDSGKDKAFKFLNRILTRVFLILLGIAAFGMALSLAYRFILASEERFILGASFTAIMMPYMIFICLAAVLCGALNVLGAFLIPSLNAVWLNVAIISSTLIGGIAYGQDTVSIAKFMCAGALLGGLLQLMIPAWELRRKGWQFRPDFGKSPEISELFKLFLPALIGAGVIQMNMLASNMLALIIDDAAVSSIYISSRLVELPIGMFTIAVATVYFPKLAMLSDAKKSNEYSAEYAKGLISIMFISLPAACGLFVLNEDILRLFFEWGKFDSADVKTCGPILAVSAIGIPFYSLATFSTRGFHSLKDTKTPVKVSVCAFAINIACALALMGPYGAKGLVGANVISAIFQSAVLNWSFRKRRAAKGVPAEILKTLIATLTMSASLYFFRPFVLTFTEGKLTALLSCVVLIPLGFAVYMLALFALRFKGFSEIKKFLKKDNL